MELLLCTATLLRGSGRCNSCNTLPHRPGGGGELNSCNARAHQLGGRGVLPRKRSLPNDRDSCNALPHCPGAVGIATPAMHCLTAWGEWTVELLLCTTPLPAGSGRCNSCNAPPHCLRAVGSATPAYALPHCPGAVGSETPVMHCHTAWGHWAVEVLLCTATLSGGSGYWNSYNALPQCLGAVGSGTPADAPPHCLEAVGSATPAIHCLTASGQWACNSCICTATLLRGGGQLNSCDERAHQLGGRGVLPRRRSLPKDRNSCNALVHCLGAMGGATPTMNCLTAWGLWAVESLQCTTSLPRGRRRRRRSACRGPTYGEPWRRPSGAPRRLCRGSPPSYLR